MVKRVPVPVADTVRPSPVGLVVECGPGVRPMWPVRPFNGAIGANPDPVMGRFVETK